MAAAIDLDQLRKFIDYERSRFDQDRKAMKESRQMANGDTWRKSFDDITTTIRHKVRVDAVNQIINKICSKFTSNPFRFLADNTQLQLDYNSYDTSIALAFRDSVVCGQGFVYVNYATGKATRLDAGSVMMASGIDTAYVVCISKESHDPNIYVKPENLGFDDSVIEFNPETEHLVFSVYKKTPEGIVAARIANGAEEASELLPISEYPVIRIAAEEAWDKDKLTYRGLYHKAQGVSDLIDIVFSRIATNILTAPRVKYWVSNELAASEAFRKTMKDINSNDVAYIAVPTLNNQGQPIPYPQRDDGRILVDELVAVTDKLVQYINMLFGFETAENADTGNKTAQEILFRKENQNANYSQYLFNLSVAIGNVCKIYENITGQKVSIVSGPYENIYRQTSQQAILAINDYCTMQPSRAMIAPLLIKFSNLDEQTKQELNQVIAQETQVQQLIANAQQTQQQLQQMQGQNQQMQQAFAALKNQQLNVDKSIGADMSKEQMRLQDKAADRAFKAGEAEKDRAVELLKIELANPIMPPEPLIETAAVAASDLNPLT
jgi:hypothetical protein